MNILALDTSTEFLSLALHLADSVYAHHSHAGQSHSQLILPSLRALLDEADVTLQQLDGIAFGAGPGSFTGLRIGCGIAQGLAFGAGLPVLGISTLLALAENTSLPQHPAAVVTPASRVIACMDARMGEVYHAAYIKQDGAWQEASPPGLYKPEAVPALPGQGWTAVGSGWRAYAQALAAVYAEQLMPMPLSNGVDDYPSAPAIARLALPLFAAGLGRPAAEAAPVYIRNKVALKTNERSVARAGDRADSSLFG